MFFRRSAPSPNRELDLAALNLAFYLASWGMYRGSSFLLQYDYTAHRPVVEVLSDTSYSELWSEDFGARPYQRRLTPVILRLADSLREAYQPLAREANSAGATDTLVTKVMLGTLGCLPACDQLFVRGFKSDGFEYSYLNRAFIDRVFEFCQDHLAALQAAQSEVSLKRGLRYPLMKLVDMHFWQAGFNLSRKDERQA